MYLYRVGSWSFEGGPLETLAHDELFTKEELLELVSKIISNVIKQDLNTPKQQRFYTCANIVAENFGYIITDTLIKEYGFYKPHFISEVVPFGWKDLLCDDGSWNSISKDDDYFALFNRLTNLRFEFQDKFGRISGGIRGIV